MKKVLFLSMIAVTFMACNLLKNEPSAVSDTDKKATAVATVNSASMLGNTPEAASKSLTDAGFKKVSSSRLPEFAPQRRDVRRAPQRVTDGATIDYYVYGLPSNIESMSEDEIKAAVFLALKQGKSMVQANVMYSDNKVSAVASAFIAPANKSNVTLYTNASNELYERIRIISSVEKSWEGEITNHNGNSTDQSVSYTDHSSFVSSIAAFTSMDATEYGYVITPESVDDGLYYAGLWYCPSEEEIQQLSKEKVVAFVTGGTAVANTSMEDYFFD